MMIRMSCRVQFIKIKIKYNNNNNKTSYTEYMYGIYPARRELNEICVLSLIGMGVGGGKEKHEISRRFDTCSECVTVTL